MEDIKTELYKRCLAFAEQRIETAQTALEQAAEASNDDTKSSAGDKFETTREMMQQEITRNKSLLLDAQENLKLLNQISDVNPSERVKNGSLVKTSQGSFYISISAGQLQLEGQTIFAISAVSPIGKLLLGKEKGDTFAFNGKTYLLEEVL